jgi:hypothetical protein
MRCFVEPLVSKCPAEKRAIIIPPIVPDLLRYLCDRLRTEWNKLSVDGNTNNGAGQTFIPLGEEDDSEDEDDEIREEIIRNRQIRTLTIGLMDLLGVWFMLGRKRTTEVGLTEFFFLPECSKLLESVVLALLSPFEFNEPSAVLKAINVLKLFLPKYSPVHHPVMASLMVKKILQGLKNPGFADVFEAIHLYFASHLAVVFQSASQNLALQTLMEEGIPEPSLQVCCFIRNLSPGYHGIKITLHVYSNIYNWDFAISYSRHL